MDAEEADVFGDDGVAGADDAEPLLRESTSSLWKTCSEDLMMLGTWLIAETIPTQRKVKAKASWQSKSAKLPMVRLQQVREPQLQCQLQPRMHQFSSLRLSLKVVVLPSGLAALRAARELATPYLMLIFEATVCVSFATTHVSIFLRLTVVTQHMVRSVEATGL
jgi:hypothetical protein